METNNTYRLPGLDLLNKNFSETVSSQTEILEKKFDVFKIINGYRIRIDDIKASPGPVVTLFEIVLSSGAKFSKIKKLETDIELSLATLDARIINPIPKKSAIGIELPNAVPQTVSIESVLNSEKFTKSNFELPIALGKTFSNEDVIVDLAKLPHLLIAGATGKGKSVCISSILLSLLYKKQPSELKFVFIDPKKSELNEFRKIQEKFIAKVPGNAEPIIHDSTGAVNALNSLCAEMDKRYELLKDASVRNIKEYNSKISGNERLPYIVVVIDEYADLITTTEEKFESPIARLAQLSRPVGIHLIISTQRPSVNIITGTIKANFSSRIAFRTTSRVDSRTILDSVGAEKLTISGDALFLYNEQLTRLQCAFPEPTEIDKVCEFICTH